MRPIGGFFELEVGRGNGPYHLGALPLTSGRACFRLILEKLKPRHVYLPFYTCDALLQPLQVMNISYSFYPIDLHLQPDIPYPLSGSDLLVWTNYFGLKQAVDTATFQTKAVVIVDSTQAFFVQPARSCWSFNSARKFFGVPDGGYLYTPIELHIDYPRNESISWDHLIWRLMGRQREAFEAFQASEHTFSADILLMSKGAEKILAGIDYSMVAARRRRNFETYEAALGRDNQLLPRREPNAVPMCYPFLPPRTIPHESLHAQSIFIPRLWADCISRETTGYQWERDMSTRLLPLPVDQRYGPEDVAEVISIIDGLMRV